LTSINRIRARAWAAHTDECAISGADWEIVGSGHRWHANLDAAHGRTWRASGRQLYERHVIPGYGHIDCRFGKNAAKDVYPLVIAQLGKTALV
jgi:cholesterol oxidase